MATIIKDRIGDSVNANFADLRAWWLARNGNLVASGVRIIAELEPQGWHSTNNKILLMTQAKGNTDSDNYYTIRALPGHEFLGNFHDIDNVPWLSSFQFAGFEGCPAHTRLEHFVIRHSGGQFADDAVMAMGVEGSGVVIDSLGFWQIRTSQAVPNSSTFAAIAVSVGSGATIKNCFINTVNCTALSNSADECQAHAFGMIMQTQGGIKAYNNTIGNITAHNLRVPDKDEDIATASAYGLQFRNSSGNFIKNNYVYSVSQVDSDPDHEGEALDYSLTFAGDNGTIFAHNFGEDSSAVGAAVLDFVLDSSGNRGGFAGSAVVQDEGAAQGNCHLVGGIILETSGVPFEHLKGHTRDIDGTLRGTITGGAYDPFPFSVGADQSPSGLDIYVQEGVPLYVRGTQTIPANSGIDLFMPVANQASNRFIDIFNRGDVEGNYTEIAGNWAISNSILYNASLDGGDIIQLNYNDPLKYNDVTVTYELMKDYAGSHVQVLFPKFWNVGTDIRIGIYKTFKHIIIQQHQDGVGIKSELFTTSALPFPSNLKGAKAVVRSEIVGSAISVYLNDEFVGVQKLIGSGLNRGQPAFAPLSSHTEPVVGITSLQIGTPQMPLTLQGSQNPSGFLNLYLSSKLTANSIDDGFQFYFEDFNTEIPNQILNLAFWITTESGVILDGADVDGWLTKFPLPSISGTTLVDPSERPVYSATGFPTGPPAGTKSRLTYDGVNDTMRWVSPVGGIITGSGYTIFSALTIPSGDASLDVYFSANTHNSTNGIFLQMHQTSARQNIDGVNTNVHAGVDAGNFKGTNIHVQRFNGIVFDGWVSGSGYNQNTDTLSSGPIPSGDIFIGCRPDGGGVWDSDLSEIIIYNRVLPNAEINTVANYMADKWTLGWEDLP